MRMKENMTHGISIVTAIHNSLAMNRFYWKMLKANTFAPFQLIIVDNHSTDGSEAFFLELEKAQGKDRVTYLRNPKNQSYPASQNQGMRFANHEVLCFLNNDIWLEKGWDQKILKELKKNHLQVLSPSGQEAQPQQSLSDSLKRKWKRINSFSKLWKHLLRKTEEQRLEFALKRMYGDLNTFQSPTPQTAPFPGIKGDAVIFHKDLLRVLENPWDERIEASDWHLYLSLAKLHEENQEIPLPKVMPSVYCHHFGRYSARQKFEPLNVTFLKLEEMWKEADIHSLWWGYQLPK